MYLFLSLGMQNIVTAAQFLVQNLVCVLVSRSGDVQQQHCNYINCRLVFKNNSVWVLVFCEFFFLDNACQVTFHFHFNFHSFFRLSKYSKRKNYFQQQQQKNGIVCNWHFWKRRQKKGAFNKANIKWKMKWHSRHKFLNRKYFDWNPNLWTKRNEEKRNKKSKEKQVKSGKTKLIFFSLSVFRFLF